MAEIRLEKYLSEAGILSRRETKAAIARGFIRVNGKTVTETGIKIHPERDHVELHEQLTQEQQEKTTVMVYKPRGVICAKDTDSGKTVFDIFPHFKKLNSVGRLDKESEGLLLLSNDGMITKAITGKDHRIEKEYIVTVREDVLPWMMEKMISGIRLNDGMAYAVQAEKLSKHEFRIVLKEGRKHQIRRMSDAVHLTIQTLKRVRIGNLHIRKMKPGQFKKLTGTQTNQLKVMGL